MTRNFDLGSLFLWDVPSCHWVIASGGFRDNVMVASSWMASCTSLPTKIRTLGSFETSVVSNAATQRHSPEDSNFQFNIPHVLGLFDR
jgi:hypothetical protein